jgi:uncharacterized protein (TIGR02646 family)
VIRIDRGPEPTALSAAREEQLKTVSAVKPTRTDSHREAYSAFKYVLAERQRKKCCYCERIVTASFNDVEHYRPFSHYWWLAWTWENLLFACAPCNRSGKNDAFPLATGSTPLQFGELPPGAERPLMLDPATDDPRRHIRFLRVNGKWHPIGEDERGRETLRVLRFDDEYDDRVQRRVRDVMGWVGAVRDAIRASPRNPERITVLWRRMTACLLDADQEFLALTEDVLRGEFRSFPDAPEPESTPNAVLAARST